MLELGGAMPAVLMRPFQILIVKYMLIFFNIHKKKIYRPLWKIVYLFLLLIKLLF